ncbi:MAG: enoyl-CoA hydratase/isomerase family protein [Candidatus Heimdallarchaeota archaeon]
MSAYQHLKIARDMPIKRSVTVILNRPEVHNAFDAVLIHELIDCFRELGKDPLPRVVVLTGSGRSFCAGADLNWMRETVDYSKEENLADAEQLAQMFATLNTCPKPVVARINGAAIGGGSGLVAASDIAVAVEYAKFGFGEVKVGIIPSVISPYVLPKIGVSQARELFLTGARIDAQRAKEIGLIHHVVASEELDQKVQEIVGQLLSSGPQAIAECKRLLRIMESLDPRGARSFTTQKIAEVRATPEARDGLTAFLEKHEPPWMK